MSGRNNVDIVTNAIEVIEVDGTPQISSQRIRTLSEKGIAKPDPARRYEGGSSKIFKTSIKSDLQNGRILRLPHEGVAQRDVQWYVERGSTAIPHPILYCSGIKFLITLAQWPRPLGSGHCFHRYVTIRG